MDNVVNDRVNEILETIRSSMREYIGRYTIREAEMRIRHQIMVMLYDVCGGGDAQHISITIKSHEESPHHLDVIPDNLFTFMAMHKAFVPYHIVHEKNSYTLTRSDGMYPAGTTFNFRTGQIYYKGVKHEQINYIPIDRAVP